MPATTGRVPPVAKGGSRLITPWCALVFAGLQFPDCRSGEACSLISGQHMQPRPFHFQQQLGDPVYQDGFAAGEFETRQFTPAFRCGILGVGFPSMGFLVDGVNHFLDCRIGPPVVKDFAEGIGK